MTTHKMYLASLSILIFCGCSSFLDYTSANASPLEELAQSPEMQKFERESKVIAAQHDASTSWLKPGSNLEKVFASTSNGAKDIISWVDTAATTWRKSKISARKRPEYISAQAHYRNDNLNIDVDLKILVPHPRYQEIVKLRLLKDFTDLEPPAFKPISDDVVNIQGNPAHVYLKSGQKCSVVIKITADALVSVEASDCSSASPVITFAKSLNISRLNRKLDS